MTQITKTEPPAYNQIPRVAAFQKRKQKIPPIISQSSKEATVPNILVGKKSSVKKRNVFPVPHVSAESK